MTGGFKLRVENVDKTFRLSGQNGRVVEALSDVTFALKAHELVAIIGPSGCGKSTLLKIVHGLMPCDRGGIFVDDQLVKKPGFDRALVFQHAGLLPWRTAIKNVELGLEAKRVPARERTAVARECLRLVGLTSFEHAYPHQLSGGMQQRVGLGRALAVNPDILLMDEPFGALDAQTRERLQHELIHIHETTAKTVLFVTHDLDEAVYLADRVIVMHGEPGRIAANLDVPLPRPRGDAAEVKSQREFVETRRHLWELLRTTETGVLQAV
jgi:NitT/TauT family transport system ATP-binding protein